MIPQNFITEWAQHTPWQNNAQVEQDLILSRALVEIFSDPLLKETLVFRGGTALHKLFSPHQERYSEDLDFVQKEAGPIGEILTHLHATLDPWLGHPKWKQTQGRVTLYYRYDSEIPPSQKMRVKVEVNTREHFHHLPLVAIPFHIQNRWFTGEAAVSSYALEELLGTKLRALYQRKKGRDLFDLMVLLEAFPDLNTSSVVDCFLFYLEKEGGRVSRAEFEKNMAQKIKDALFQEDILPLLHPKRMYDQSAAYALVHQRLIQLLPGTPWEG